MKIRPLYRGIFWAGVLLTLTAIGAYLSPLTHSHSMRLFGVEAELTKVFEFDGRHTGFATEGPWLFVSVLPSEVMESEVLSKLRLKKLPRYLMLDSGERAWRWKSFAELTEEQKYVVDECLTDHYFRSKWSELSKSDPRLEKILLGLTRKDPDPNLLITAIYRISRHGSSVVTDVEMVILDTESGIVIEVGWWT